jgi:SAM-dependent methyltransferase
MRPFSVMRVLGTLAGCAPAIALKTHSRWSLRAALGGRIFQHVGAKSSDKWASARQWRWASARQWRCAAAQEAPPHLLRCIGPHRATSLIKPWVYLAPARILDVGCGTGELPVKCAHRWPKAELVGVDLSRSMLARARAKSWGKRRPALKEANVYDLPFAGGTFDLVFNSISSHFYRDGEQAFSELGGVTAPGGHSYQASLGTKCQS